MQFAGKSLFLFYRKLKTIKQTRKIFTQTNNRVKFGSADKVFLVRF